MKKYIDFKTNKIKNLLLSDIKIINKYLLTMIVFVILMVAGSISYALFVFEFESDSIMLLYDDIKGPICVINGPDVSEIGVNSNTTYIMNCTDNFGVVDTILTSDNFTITGDITISNITKEQIDNGYKYNITILSGTTNTTGNIKLNSNVIQDINGNYNKESNVSNNVVVTSYKNFYIVYGGQTLEYHFDEGMTFNDFISSKYNDGNISNDSGYLAYNTEYEVYSGSTRLTPDKSITINATYTTKDTLAKLVISGGRLKETSNISYDGKDGACDEKIEITNYYGAGYVTVNGTNYVSTTLWINKNTTIKIYYSNDYTTAKSSSGWVYYKPRYTTQNYTVSKNTYVRLNSTGKSVNSPSVCDAGLVYSDYYDYCSYFTVTIS